MSIYQISVLSWHQGQYAGAGMYTGSNSYISSGPISIDPVAHSIRFTTNPVELDYWRKDGNNQWEIYDTQAYRDGGVSIMLLDENESSLYSSSTTYDVEINLDNYPAAKYLVVTATEDRGTVNRNIMAIPPTSEDTQSTWYTMHSTITYTYEAYNWYMDSDNELANDYIPTDVPDFTTPIPFSNWTIIQGVNSDFPINGGYQEMIDLESIPMPLMYWRITEGYNNNFPFNDLIPNIPQTAPPHYRNTYSAGLTYQLQKIKNFMLLIEQEIEDTNYIWSLDENDDVTLLFYLGQYSNIKVPTQIEGHPVKYIAPSCYNYNTRLISVNIPDGIISIG